MSRIKLIILGAILVGIIGSMTMIASFPKLYSPYSFTIVIPALFVSSLNLPPLVFRVVSVLPLVVLFLLWSFSFVKPPFRITLTQKIISGLFIILSVVFNTASFSYGLTYQGELHTYLMYTYNIILLLCLSLILWKNAKKPSLNSCMGFGVLLFAWLGWVAFPWLGELI
jgi:hypothetical protein